MIALKLLLLVLLAAILGGLGLQIFKTSPGDAYRTARGSQARWDWWN